MKQRTLNTFAFSSVLVATVGFGIVAAEDTVYGRDLMTEQERAEHRERMRQYESESEREKYRNEHHKRVQEQAMEQGVKIPDEPSQRGRGYGGTGGGQSGNAYGRGGGRR